MQYKNAFIGIFIMKIFIDAKQRNKGTYNIKQRKLPLFYYYYKNNLTDVLFGKNFHII